jgi:FHS family L-fucose permease-like MFS transporter
MATSQISKKTSEASLFPAGYVWPFFLVTALFFLWGIPNNLNDVLIRQFMKSFSISRFQAGLVQSAFYLGYFVLALPAGLLMRKWGYKAGFITGLLLFGTGAFLFWPAAIVGRYWSFLLALFVIASGLSFLETASNPFIAQCGDPRTSERRLNFSQAFNPLGSITGVLLGTAFIFSGVELSPQQISSMQAAGTLQSYLREETLRVVRGTWARENQRLVPLPPLSRGGGGTVSLRRRAGRDMELLHSVCAGIRSSSRENCWILSDWNAGCLWHRAVRLFIPDEVRCP